MTPAQRLRETKEKFWTLSPDGHSQSRFFLGFNLRIEIEDEGYRLFVNDERRGYFDTSQAARSHSIWLVDNGNPIWVGEGESDNEGGESRAPYHQQKKVE